MSFVFLVVAIQKQSFFTICKHIYIVNAIKSSEKCSKNNLQSGSSKLDFPNISSLKDDLIEFSHLHFNIFKYYLILLLLTINYSKDPPKFFKGGQKLY